MFTPMQSRLKTWLIVFGVVLGVAILPALLSSVVDFRLPGALRERFSLVGTVREFTWQRLDLAALGWGPSGQETVEVGAVSVDFSPFSLLRKKVAGATFSDLTVHLVKGQDGFSLRGFSPPQTTNFFVASEQEWRLPVGAGRLDISQGRILIHDQDSVTAVSFQLHIEAVEDQPQRLQFVLDLFPEIHGARVSGEIDLASKTVRANLTSLLPAPIEAGSLSGEFSGHLAQGGGWRLMAATVFGGLVTGDGLTIKTSAGQLQSAPVHLDCKGQGQGGGGTVDCSLTTERVTLDDLGLELSGLAIASPWQWPAGSSPPVAGSVKVALVKARGKKLGALEMSVWQKGLYGCQFSGEMQNVGVSKYGLKIKGEAGVDSERQAPELDLEVNLPRLNLGEIDLAEFIDLKEKVVVGGTLKGKAKVRLHGGLREASAEMAISEGLLVIAKKGQEVTGIAGEVNFPDLIGLRSDMAHFSFQKAKFGDLDLADGDLAFSLDGANSLFVEKAKAGWSDGTVSIMALRLTPGNRDFEVELTCEQLDIVQVFGQLGVSQFKGKGSVSGRLPLAYKDGALRVTQGFLQSSPGGGSIRMAAHDLITAGVPAGTPQFGQLEFAAAALQDFTYNSLTIALDSKDDNMAVVMKLDGRPTRALPFRYDASLGTFTRLSAAGEVGIDQSMKLDVNFLLPVNTLLDYGKDIKSLWDRMQ